MVNSVWEIKKRVSKDLIRQLLASRNIVSEKEKKKFFSPDFEKDIYDPFLLLGMKKAILRIKKAKDNNETIGIFSDYDADGIPAAALLFRALNEIDVKTEVYIPNRESGYGLSREGIEYLISRKCGLIITADLGIRNLDEANYCITKKVDLIITDHHILGEEIPKAVAVINPKMKDNKYPFNDLCGCGVIFKLTQALSQTYPKKINEKFLKWNLDLVAISTIADVVTLADENRTIAKFGLMVLKKTKNIGLKALIKQANINKDEINAYTVGFQIAPRINAPGRIDHATKSFELLTTEDENKAKELALWLEEKNCFRQEAMEEAEKEAMKIIEKENQMYEKIILVSGKWQKGVIGPVASRICEKFIRPTILFSEDGEYFCGSARSVEGVNIVEILEDCGELLKKYGGHRGAAGVTVSKKNYIKFCKKIREIASKKVSNKCLTKKIKIDAEIDSSNLTHEITDLIEKMEPFGMGNPRPIFMFQSAVLSNMKRVGKNASHLSFFAKINEKIIKAICFNFDEIIDSIKNETKYDLAFTLENNYWNEKRYLNLKIIDIKEDIK